METRPNEAAWDAVIVGGGPSGSIAAIGLARRGHRVLVVDRRRFPRDKACGDGLIPDALGALARHGLLDRVTARATRFETARVYGPYRASVEVSTEMLTIRRHVLDAELVTAATEAGAVVAQGLVSDVMEGADGVTLKLADGTSASARIACIATGANVTLLERCGLLQRSGPSAVAIRTYIHSSAGLAHPLVSFDRHVLPGYGWIFPMGNGVFNVGCGTVTTGVAEPPDLRGMLAEFLDRFPPARELATAEQRREALRGALLRCGLTGANPYSGGRVFAVGESIGSTYPLTGEGIGKAMETAELGAALASRVLTGEEPRALDRYAPELRARFAAKYRGYELAAWCASHPWLLERLLSRAARRPRLRRAFSDILAERVPVQRVFSLRGLAKALVG